MSLWDLVVVFGVCDGVFVVYVVVLVGVCECCCLCCVFVLLIACLGVWLIALSFVVVAWVVFLGCCLFWSL